jgi:hypothetical protein
MKQEQPSHRAAGRLCPHLRHSSGLGTLPERVRHATMEIDKKARNLDDLHVPILLRRLIFHCPVLPPNLLPKHLRRKPATVWCGQSTSGHNFRSRHARGWICGRGDWSCNALHGSGRNTHLRLGRLILFHGNRDVFCEMGRLPNPCRRSYCFPLHELSQPCSGSRRRCRHFDREQYQPM